MAIKQQLIHPFGMKQDNIINSKDNSSTYAVDIKNLRFNTIDDLTTGVWTTEKGNVNVPLHIVDGITEEKYTALNTIIHKVNCITMIGSAVINEQWILFGILKTNTYKKDFILKLWYEANELFVDLLYQGDLNFNVEHPLETMVYYENEEIQKVYWTDNFNQPRFINVVNVKHWQGFDDQFDFVKEVSLDEQVYVWKESGQNGIWNAGTVKYALTYFNKYGQESNIIWTSTLLYPLVADRGCDSDEISGDMMHVMAHITNDRMLESWDCLRLYSIYRSSEGAKPIVKIVEDRELKVDEHWYHFADSNTTGVVTDSDRLMFVGGKEICCETFNQKDGTMFMGNITLKKRSIDALLKEYGIEDNDDWFVVGETTGFVSGKTIAINDIVDNNDLTNGEYLWANQLNYKDEIVIPFPVGQTTDLPEVQIYNTVNPNIFKFREWYRFGVQFQDKLGNWSEVHHIKDVENDIKPTNIDPTRTSTGKFKYVLPNSIRQILVANGYVKARLVYCPPTNANRRVLAQGLISGTIYNNKWNREDTLHCMHSYFYRYDEIVNDNTLYSDFGKYEIQSCVPTYDMFSGQPISQMVNISALQLAGSPSYYSYTQPQDCRRFEITSSADPLKTALINVHSGSSEINTLLASVAEDNNTFNGYTFIRRLVETYRRFNNSEFHSFNKIVTLSSPDIEFDDSIRTLDYTGVQFRQVGVSHRSSKVGWMYLDVAKQAMDYLGNKGTGLKRHKINMLHGVYSEQHEENSFAIWLRNRLGEWNDIDVYNANSVTKDEDEGERDDDEPRHQYQYITHDYFIYPFQRKYLNNYMGDLTIQMYKKGTDPEYNVVESSVINEKVIAYKRTGYNNDYYSTALEKPVEDIQIYDAIGDSVLKLKSNTPSKYLSYAGNINSIAPLCNYKDIYDAIYNKQIWDSNGELTELEHPEIMWINSNNAQDRHIASPFYNLLCWYKNTTTLSFSYSQLLYQPMFECPIFKYQGLNIVTDSTFLYENVNTNWEDSWRKNWTWDDYASIFTGVGWSASIINNLRETQGQQWHYEFTPIQESEILAVDKRTRFMNILTNMITGNWPGFVMDCIKFNDKYQAAIVINRYKGAYPIATIIKSVVNNNNEKNQDFAYRNKFGLVNMTMPSYVINDVNSNNYYDDLETIATNNNNIQATEEDVTDVTDSELLEGNLARRICWPVGVSSDPVKFSYKTTPHAVISLHNTHSVNAWQLGELYREIDVPTDSLIDPSFGNIELTAYIPCSKSFNLENGGGNLALYHDEGDYYYMRYDNLRTYPYEEHPINGIVDIMSYMVETRINLDGRCDKKRKDTDNTTATRSNYNVVNKAYTQHDNYFTFFCIDDLSKRLDKFKNMITWSKTKINGDLIDTWTNVTIVNTDDADGSCGAIMKIVNVNNNLLALQEHALVQLGYNEKTAISTENGVPLEMANSGKFTGFNYISKDYGCQNKWSVNNNNLGLWFIDDSRREILQYSSEGMMSLSKNAGFDSFMIQNLENADKTWKPLQFNNFITFYDKLSKDLYYLNNKNCLTYNETSHTFTSFYDYYGISAMANLGSHFLMWGGLRGVETEEYEEVIEQAVPVEQQSLTKLVTILGVTDINAPNPTPLQYSDVSASYTYIPISNPYGSTIKIPVASATKPLDGKFVNISFSLDTISSDGISFEQPPYSLNGSYTIKIKWKVLIGSELVDKWIQFDIRTTVSISGGTADVRADVSSLSYSDNLQLEEGDVKVLAFVQKPGHLSYSGVLNILVGNTIFDTDTFNSEATQIWNDAVTFTKDSSTCILDIDVYTHNSTSYSYTNPIAIDYSNGNGQHFVSNTIKAGETQTVVLDNIPVAGETITETVIDTRTLQSGIWATRENEEYSKFFNEYSPYWITLMSDGGNELRMFDKVFNTIEYRADLYDDNTLVDNYGINAYLFTDIAAWNGYQFYKEFDILDKETTLAFPFERKLSDRYEWQSERKFNVWRTILPRATYKDGNEFVTSRDRIRNPFTFIKLVNNHPEFNRMPDGVGSHRMVLHEFTVNFDVR